MVGKHQIPKNSRFFFYGSVPFANRSVGVTNTNASTEHRIQLTARARRREYMHDEGFAASNVKFQAPHKGSQ